APKAWRTRPAQLRRTAAGPRASLLDPPAQSGALYRLHLLFFLPLHDLELPAVGRIELDRLDALKVLRDLAAGALDVLGVLVRLAYVIGEPLHALLEAPEVLSQAGEAVADDVDLLASLDVLQHRPCRVQHRHQGRRGHDPHPLAVGVIHGLRVIRVDFGEY